MKKLRRTFLGFRPFGHAHEKLTAIQSEFKKYLETTPSADHWRWVRPESLHLTLHFIGPTSDAALAKILETLTSVKEASACIQKLDRLVGFPTQSRARVASLGTKTASDGLRTLWSLSGKNLFQSPTALENRRFQPHITMARMRKPVALPDWQPPPFELKIDRISLFESQLGDGLARYEIIEEFPLAATPGS